MGFLGAFAGTITGTDDGVVTVVSKVAGMDRGANKVGTGSRGFAVD
ncbi:hypothetical protein RSSM_04079 [Rhodopirellula sallentina SM41]|uniref:Uncharacterized protein n=1 Tax=Rhodopirellula sallentina SM41 TaxID=1263870 RepID=M5TZM3_9BACT|nr:hypothetical protein RSSM_04079 [Rhodopirellula sallentina SM41]